MKSNTVKDALNECIEISSDIMNKVGNQLSSEGLKFSRPSDSEIIIENNSKDDIKNLVYSIEGATEQQLKLLLQITESNNKVFIRQKFN